jgi:hypothetical protein
MQDAINNFGKDTARFANALSRSVADARNRLQQKRNTPGLPPDCLRWLDQLLKQLDDLLKRIIGLMDELAKVANTLKGRTCDYFQTPNGGPTLATTTNGKDISRIRVNLDEALDDYEKILARIMTAMTDCGLKGGIGGRVDNSPQN